MKHAIDVSNYSGPITVEQFVALRDQCDIGAVLVQSLDPPAGYPPGVTQQQINAALLAGGIAVHAYIFWWYEAGLAYLRRQLALLEPFAGALHRLWIDVEDTSGGVALTARLGSHYSAEMTFRPPEAAKRIARQVRPNTAHATLGARLMLAVSGMARTNDVQSWLTTADAYHTLLQPSGVYSAAWYWGPYMANTALFAADGRPAWPATYNGMETLTDWQKYGGWSGAAPIHQYAGTSSLLDVNNVDLNVIGDSEMALPDPATDDPIDQGWLDKKALVVSTAGELVTLADELDGEIRQVIMKKSNLRNISQGVRARANRILS